MASLFSGDTTTQTNVPGASGVEKTTQQLTLDQLNRQAGLESMYDPILKGQIQDLLDEQAVRQGKDASSPEATAKWKSQIDSEKNAQDSASRLNDINSQLAEANLKAVQQGGAATPEQAALIDQATQGQQQAGEADIGRFLTGTLRQINEEAANASGLRSTDTPVVRLSERAGEEAARQQGMLTSNLRTANANAKLNFPLAATSLTSGIAGAQQQLGLAGQNFSQMLAQRAQDNRYRLFAGNPTSQFGVNPVSFAKTLADVRVAGSTKDVSSTPSLLGQIGQAGQGIGAVMSLFSDRRLKRDIFRIGEFPSGLPIYIFRFHGFEDWHVGVMADEAIGVVPEAVFEHETGFLKVDYSMLH